jgi:hypothetical protein
MSRTKSIIRVLSVRYLLMALSMTYSLLSIPLVLKYLG